MAEQDKKEDKKDKLKIKPPTQAEILRAAQERLFEDPAIQKLIKAGKKVFIDTDTLEVRIIEEEGEKGD